MLGYLKQTLTGFAFSSNKIEGKGAPIMGTDVVDLIHKTLDSDMLKRLNKSGGVDKIDISIHVVGD